MIPSSLSGETDSQIVCPTIDSGKITLLEELLRDFACVPQDSTMEVWARCLGLTKDVVRPWVLAATSKLLFISGVRM